MAQPTAVRARHVQTQRLRTHMFEAGTAGERPVLLIHGNVAAALFYTDLLANAPDGYHLLAPDLRGFGDSETKPVDATRGVRDWSDDLHSLVEALELVGPIALVGWSLGGGVAMQYAIDHPALVHSLTLIAPISPHGFGATKGTNGELTTPDGAGSGGGIANADFVNLLTANDMGSASQVSPRNVMNSFYFKPPFRVDSTEEDRFVAAMNQTATGTDNYPGNSSASPHWPQVAPGDRGVLNAIAPRHFDLSSFAAIDPKPPVLWVRGADDQIVSDTSLFDLGFLGQLGAVPGWPGAKRYPPQPMIGQTRALLERYQANGGSYREVVYAHCGHSPHIEKATEFTPLLWEFLGA